MEPIRRLLALPIALGLVAAACGGSDSTDAAAETSTTVASDTTAAPETTVEDTTTVPPTTAAPETTAAETTAAPETTVAETTTSEIETTTTTSGEEVDGSAICGLFVDWFGREFGDPAPGAALAEHLTITDQPELLALYDIASDEDLPWFDAAEGLWELDLAVDARCRELWLADVPSLGGDTQTAFDTFLVALGTGDRELAATVASPRALAADEWLGWDGFPNADKPGKVTNAMGTLNGDSASFILAPTIFLYCEFDRGVVATCVYGE